MREMQRHGENCVGPQVNRLWGLFMNQMINEKPKPNQDGRNLNIEATSNGWIVSTRTHRKVFTTFSDVVNDGYVFFGLHNKISDKIILALDGGSDGDAN